MNGNGSPSSSHRVGRARIGVLICILAVSMLLIAVLGRELATKMEGLSTSQSDNVQWTLSRLEVDRLRLAMAIEAASHEEVEDLSEVRRRYDLFYSRVSVVQDGDAYATLRQSDASRDAMAAIATFLSETTPLIDGPDETLQSALPDLLQRVERLEPAARQIALTSINAFAVRSDIRRQDIFETLRLAGLATAFLLFVLALVVFLLMRDTRLSAQRANRLEETSTRLSTLVSTSLDAIIAADTDGKVLEFNDAAERIFGFSRAEAIGESMHNLFIPDHHVAAHAAGMKRYLETGEKHVLGKGRVQLEAKRKSGELFPVELSISSAMTPEGEIFVSYLRDISARVKAEAELVKARDDALAGERAKAKFMAIMSHEMRTPLNGIIGTLDLIRTTDLGETQRQYVEMMDFSGQRLLEHVNDVLDISKIEAEEQAEPEQVIHIENTLRQSVDSQASLAQAAGNSIDLNVLTPLPDLLMGDPAKVSRIVLNLLGNAIKFTSNGKISVEVELAEAGDQQSIIEIRVADTGKGIAEDDQERIFEDFVTLEDSYSRTNGGTGLGLGITRRLVHSLAGEIGVESEIGVGSVFWVRLPFNHPKSKTTKNVDPAEQRDGNNPPRVAPVSVLLVEDNQINQVVAQRMLEGDNHKVTLAKDGVDAVMLASQSRFDIIFMDISMPRMDGIEATEHIRSGDGPSKAVPIVALTAHTREEDVQAFRAAGMDGYLAKPVRRNLLRQTLVEQGFPTDTQPSDTATFQESLDDSREIENLLNSKFAEQIHDFIQFVESDTEAVSPKRIADEIHKLKGSAGVLGHTDIVLKIEEFDDKSGDQIQYPIHELIQYLKAKSSTDL